MAFQSESDQIDADEIPEIIDYESFYKRIHERIENFYQTDEIPYDEISFQSAIAQVLEEKPKSRAYLYQDQLLLDLDIDDVTFCRLLYARARVKSVTIKKCMSDVELPNEQWFEQIMVEHKQKVEEVTKHLLMHRQFDKKTANEVASIVMKVSDTVSDNDLERGEYWIRRIKDWKTNRYEVKYGTPLRFSPPRSGGDWVARPTIHKPKNPKPSQNNDTD